MGKAWETAPGTWELVIDSHAGHLVRSAKFTATGRPGLLYEVETSGMKTVDGLVVATSATWLSHQSVTRGDVSLFTLESLSSNPDRDFIATVEKGMFGPFPGHGAIADWRYAPMFGRSFDPGFVYTTDEMWQQRHGEVIENIEHYPTAEVEESPSEAVPEQSHSVSTGTGVAAQAVPPEAPWWHVPPVAAFLILAALLAAAGAYTYLRRRGGNSTEDAGS
ncbi:MAG: hypothetical protein JXL80_16945 [Planctomycetes bacterium]|nr:hypothetical protein [Planctomycetota bacterium]